MRNLLSAMLIALLLVANAAHAAPQIPAGCSAQAPWGAPSWTGAQPAVSPLCRTAYVVLHDDVKLVPEFVSWQLTAEHAKGCLARKDSFAPDPDLMPGHRAELADYKNHPGYDRGHFAPNSDFEWDKDVQEQSFYLSNMSPQASHLNQWEWEELEATTRAWTLSRTTLIVMDGPIWGGTPQAIGDDRVAVPTAYWKVVVDSSSQEAIAFIMKNEPTPKGDLTPYIVSIAEVERQAGLTLPLPTGINRSKPSAFWPADLTGFATAKAKSCHRA